MITLSEATILIAACDGTGLMSMECASGDWLARCVGCEDCQLHLDIDELELGGEG